MVALSDTLRQVRTQASRIASLRFRWILRHCSLDDSEEADLIKKLGTISPLFLTPSPFSTLIDYRSVMNSSQTRENVFFVNCILSEFPLP